MQNIEFNVGELEKECKPCANIVLKKLMAYEGVKDVDIDPVTKRVRVEWDDPKACSRLTCACGVDTLGYKVSMD